MRHHRLPRVDLPGHTYFVTCSVDRRRRLLAYARRAEALIALYAEARDRGDIALHGYVIMPNHYHVMLTLRAAPSVSNVVRRAHSALSRMIRREVATEGRIWQRRFYDHVVRDERDWHEKLTYMHQNPVASGVVGDAREYPWSSCRFWETGTGPVTCDPP